LTKLLANPQFRADFSKKELEEALIAILLSKLVSFVFDYAFFELFFSNDAQKDMEGRRDRLRMFLTLKDHANQVSLKELIEKHFPGIDLDLVILILCGHPPPSSRQARLISGIVKSSIDVRVLDYLGRDSHHTSIPAGHGIDINQIIDSLTWDPETGNIGITRTGVFSVEHLLCARYWMYNRVYWNGINRALAAMIRYTMYAMMKIGDLKTNHFIKEVMNLDEPSALQWLDQEWNATANDQYKHSSILAPLLQPRPRPYRLSIELSGKTWAEKYIGAARGLLPEELEEKRLRFLQVSSFAKRLKVGDVLFDIPRDKALKLGDDIWVDTGRGKTEKLLDASEIVRVLPKAFLETAFKFRVFVNPEALSSEEERGALGAEAKKFLELEFS
jgi:HD superfamily phosphohydrolase